MARSFFGNEPIIQIGGMTVLSAKSEQFIDNLRLYLMTSGKKEEEVKEITAELGDHLAEAEKRGKDIHEITGGSPESYMKSIKEEMETDVRGIIKSAPMFLFTVLAYFVMGPAIREEFSINLIQLVGFPVIVGIGTAIYLFLLQNAGKKQYSDRKVFIWAMVSYTIVTGLFIVVLLAGKYAAPPFYEASPFVNNVIIVLCVIAFITISVWSKTWFSIIIPLVLFGPSFVMERMNLEEETMLYGTAAVSVVTCLAMVIWTFGIKRKKQPGQ